MVGCLQKVWLLPSSLSPPPLRCDSKFLASEVGSFPTPGTWAGAGTCFDPRRVAEVATCQPRAWTGDPAPCHPLGPLPTVM